MDQTMLHITKEKGFSIFALVVPLNPKSIVTNLRNLLQPPLDMKLVISFH